MERNRFAALFDGLGTRMLILAGAVLEGAVIVALVLVVWGLAVAGSP